MATMPAPTIYPKSHVGFDSITSQIERKLLKRGFQFNVICVGMFCLLLIPLVQPYPSLRYASSHIVLPNRQQGRPTTACPRCY